MAVVAHLVAVVAALAAIAVVIVLNLVAHLVLKATEVVTASKAVAIVLKTVAHLLLALKDALKVAAISVQKLAQKAVLSNGVISAANNNAASPLAVVKPALSPVAINALTIAAATASTHATAAPHAHLAVTMHAVVPVIVLPAAPKWWVLATSNHTMRAVMQHPSALAPKC